MKLIDELITNGFNSYLIVRSEDKARLTNLYLQELGTDSFETIIDFNFSQLFNSTPTLIVNELRNCAIEFCAPMFEKLFQQRCDEHHAERMMENGFHAYTDKNTGETRWIR